MIFHFSINNSRIVATIVNLLIMVIIMMGPRALSNETVNKLSNAAMQKWIKKHPHDLILPDKVASFRLEFSKRFPKELHRINALRKRFNEKLLVIPKGEKSLKYYIENMDKIRRFCGLMNRFSQGYLATGDKAFALQAKRMLMHIVSMPPDAGGGLRGCDEIPMSIMQLCPRTYDWIYDTLTAKERKQVLSCFRERGNRMWKHIGAGNIVPQNSHAGRMLGFMGEAGIVFWGEIPEAETWATKTADLVAGDYPKWGGDDGGWAEGPGYWSWYMGYMIPFLSSLRTVIGYNNTIDKPFFQNTTYYGLYCTPLTLPRSPFGDAAERNSKYTKRRNALFFGKLYRNPYFIWYANQCRSRTTFLEMLDQCSHQQPVRAKSPAALTQSKLFDSIGWIGIHSNLARPKDDIFLLFKSSPYGGQSHSHADQNSFVLSAYNMPLTIASGYYNCYASPHHYGWTRATKANNTILVNNQGQHPRKGKASIDAFLTDGNGSGITYALGNAAGVYDGKLSRALRHVIKLDATSFVLIDELTAPAPATFSWLLHSLKKMELQTKSNSLNVRNGEANCRIDLASSQGFKFSQDDKFDPPPSMAGSFNTRKKKRCPNEWHFKAETTRKNTNCIITARLNVYEGNNTPAPINNEKYIDNKKQLLMSWQQGDRKTTIELDKAKPGRLKVIVMKKGIINRYLMINDKELKHDKDLLIKTSSPVNVSLTSINNEICIGLGKGRKGALIQLKLPAINKKTNLKFRPRGSNTWQAIEGKIKNGYVIFKHPGQDGEISLN